MFSDHFEVDEQLAERTIGMIIAQWFQPVGGILRLLAMHRGSIEEGVLRRRIIGQQLVLELSNYCIQDIAQTVRSTLEPLASDKKLAFKLELVPDLPPGHGDGRRLTQVLINLVGNAIKFTDTGEVAIKAEASARPLSIE
jgi:signal transduction histidine kinase